MRGASEFEVGAQRVCPQGIPISFMDSNEAHNNEKYGLRIFTGTNHNGEGLPGFYPRKVDSCAPVSRDNPFEPSTFSNQFSWRNGMNGITFGSVAALHIVDAVVADNVMRGIEGLGGDGTLGHSGSMGQLRGAWGANMITRTTFIGHAQDGCPACDHSMRPYMAPGPVGWGLVRIGMTQPSSWGLTVENSTFINYDRPGMIAVTGFSKPDGPGYSFRGNYGGETRFVGINWIQSSYRMRWRWNDAHLLTDVDGTFTEQPSCAGCHVVRSGLLASKTAFPDCFYDPRYDALVCKPNYRFVTVFWKTKPPCGPCAETPARMSYRGPEGIYVAADDAAYLKHKWRPEGKYNLVSLDVSTDNLTMSIVGEHDAEFQGSWNHATGMWISRHKMRVAFSYVDHFDTYERTAEGYEATISEDGATLTWSLNTATTRISSAVIQSQITAATVLRDAALISNESYVLRMATILRLSEPMAINGTRQLFTDTVWHRCELVPRKCVGDGIRYPSLPGKQIGRQQGRFQILGHFQCAFLALKSLLWIFLSCGVAPWCAQRRPNRPCSARCQPPVQLRYWPIALRGRRACNWQSA